MTPAEFDALLKDTELQLTRLKHLYDQWFQGFERLEPTIVRKQFDRNLHVLRKAGVRRAALRFRFQTLIQRYTTLQTYWRRVARQIEEGTYRRDLMKVRRKREERRGELLGKKRNDPDTLQDLDIDLDQDPGAYNDLNEEPITQKTAAVRPPTQVKKPRSNTWEVRQGRASSKQTKAADGAPANSQAGAASRKGPGDARLRQLYETYVQEKKKNNEPVDHLDYEKLAKRIKKMVPELEREHKGKSVDFKVVVKDGRVGLKPIVKK